MKSFTGFLNLGTANFKEHLSLAASIEMFKTKQLQSPPRKESKHILVAPYLERISLLSPMATTKFSSLPSPVFVAV